KLFNRIAHEFRTPLTIIQGAIDRIKHDKNGDDAKRLAQIAQQSNQLDIQVSQILNLTALKSGQRPAEEERGDLLSYLKHLHSSFSSAAEQQQIQLVFQSELDEIRTRYAADNWRKIINNLVGNALKYCPSGSKIEMQVGYSTTRNLLVSVKDNGPGIDPDFQPRIFEPFTRERANHKNGSGIGLALVRELVEAMHGRIQLRSALGQGTVFTIEVPIEADAPMDTSPNPRAKDRPLVFIAEDQPEIIDYLRYCLSDDYEVLSARDGQTAWNSCREQPPDILISDIMMPGIDGLELCRLMKTHTATDHVPIVLLTAKVGPEARYAGLSQGADAYLPKPFDRKELIIRVEQLIAQRNRLRTKYHEKNGDVSTVQVASNPFLEEVILLIGESLSNPAFDVQALADACHLSRTQLFRKLKNLTGESPSEIIINARINQAIELLELGQARVSEVAYACGFQDPAYFSRLFKKKTGRTPSQHRGHQED
ncbi:MAG: ATP-binding protein, partial [Bacteroidota bacterium]